ncbi:hypothetical protein JANAI62_26740 [Jannaschia pagri]|uniref:VPLPA-CTERM protein sorting domain-containing protein n=1 Tax=Jannaschia pagri TaxID=2829797 RepID=A0ABQ4NNS3_9RHOB|nr:MULTISPECIES: VPLPA-CTERM sorting domain-containing protein [unclassified Jannaschia]GIT92216.1 hypothetical protein JANAI61_26740 [Jannaschia sp. AI_61]GIT96051.1 hypothetical protein JANAI62_26740 [Jannaschia sp. AI_62]
MAKVIIGAAAIGLGLASAASAATIHYQETFDTGLGGWSVRDNYKKRNNTPRNSVTRVDGGPSGDGYASIKDRSGNYMYLVGPQALTGDLSAMSGSEISFMLGHLGDNGRGRYATRNFGEVTLRSGSNAISGKAISGFNADGWYAGALTLSAAEFGTSESVFQSVLANVTSFEVGTESWVGVSETVGFDSFTVAAVPLPASVLMMLAAFAGLVGVGRRHAQTSHAKASGPVPTGLA